jgi:L-fuconolactonase
MRIDAHQHFWLYNAQEYGWIGPEMAGLRRDFLPTDLRPLQEALQIEGTVAVQARQTVDETEWLLQLAAQHPRIRGVVGWVDLCDPHVGRQLEMLCADERLRGVRHVVQDEPDDRFLLRPDFQRGIGLLAAFGLTYDILIYPRHLPAACEFVAQSPEQPFVLDHMAKPPIAANDSRGRAQPWAEGIRHLAEHPRVYCKVSGMVTEAAWDRWTAADFRPYLDVVVEAFGTERIMFGSDWPVCTVAGSYAEVLGLAYDYAAQFSAAEQAAMAGENAARFYGLT